MGWRIIRCGGMDFFLALWFRRTIIKKHYKFREQVSNKQMQTSSNPAVSCCFTFSHMMRFWGRHRMQKYNRMVKPALWWGQDPCSQPLANVPWPSPHLFVAAESEVTTVNRCLDAAKSCNIDETCQKLRTEYVSACIQPSARSGPCNRPKCNKALRKFFDRVPPDYTHELLFCPCTDTACAERRRQTIVPSCSYEDKEKPNCLAQLRICKSDYVCR